MGFDLSWPGLTPSQCFPNNTVGITTVIPKPGHGSEEGRICSSKRAKGKQRLLGAADGSEEDFSNLIFRLKGHFELKCFDLFWMHVRNH